MGNAHIVVAVDEKVNEVHMIYHVFNGRTVAVKMLSPLGEAGFIERLPKYDATFVFNLSWPEQGCCSSDELNISPRVDVVLQR